MFSLTAMVLTIALGAPTPVQSAQRPVGKPANPPAAAQEFSARVDAYLATRNQTAGTKSHPTESAKKIAETRAQIRDRVQRARANAKQGDIFTPHVSSYFRKQLAAAFRGPEGARVLASLRRAEPVKVRLRVNQRYPEGIPLQSTPPSLLLRLPKLPKELEYRIVGRDLVLLDLEPNLVVDILPGVVPQP